MKSFGREIIRHVTAHRVVRNPLRCATQKGMLPSSVWKRLPFVGTFDVALPDSDGVFKYNSTSANDGIGRALFWRGLQSWEAETTRIFYKLAKHAQIVLDIGANTGVYTLIACAANTDVEVIAFEPVPHIYQVLVEQIEINGIAARCQVRNEAVSDTIGTAQFHVPYGDLPTSASLNTKGFRGFSGDTIEVSTVTIDSICEGQEVDLVKIDVEGFEDHVLNGMRSTLQRSRPDIIVECNPDGPYNNVEVILREYGYRFFALQRSGPVEMDLIVPDRLERYRNYLCSCKLQVDVGAG